MQISSQDDKVSDATRIINDLQHRRSMVASSLQVSKNQKYHAFVAQ